MNGWVEQCCPTSPGRARAPRARAALPGRNLSARPRQLARRQPYDEFVPENIAARMLARVIADTFGADRSDSSASSSRLSRPRADCPLLGCPLKKPS